MLWFYNEWVCIDSYRCSKCKTISSDIGKKMKIHWKEDCPACRGDRKYLKLVQLLRLGTAHAKYDCYWGFAISLSSIPVAIYYAITSPKVEGGHLLTCILAGTTIAIGLGILSFVLQRCIFRGNFFTAIMGLILLGAFGSTAWALLTDWGILLNIIVYGTAVILVGSFLKGCFSIFEPAKPTRRR